MLFLYCKHLSFQLWSLFRFLNINGAGEGKLLFPWNYFNGYNSTSRGGTHTGSSRWAPEPGGELFIVFQRPAPLQFCLFPLGSCLIRLCCSSRYYLGNWYGLGFLKNITARYNKVKSTPFSNWSIFLPSKFATALCSPNYVQFYFSIRIFFSSQTLSLPKPPL